MKIGETYRIHSPEDKHIHGHLVTLVREEDIEDPLSPSSTMKAWLTINEATGEKRHFLAQHFDIAHGGKKFMTNETVKARP